MVEYIKKFDDSSEADGYVIENIPFIATEMATGQNICCNSYMSGEPKHISVINDKMLVNNEIWYTTSDGNSYPLEDIIEIIVNDYNGTYNGPNIISNEWDSEKNMFVMVFDDDLTVLGNIHENQYTAAVDVEGPFFITLSDFNIYCYIENIVLPESILEIGENAFFGCENLNSIELPKNILKIGDHSFYNCYSLTEINIPSSVIQIGEGAFFNCENLETINIEYGLKYIGRSAFSSCLSLNSIELPNSVESIGAFTFYNCGNLQSVNIPNKIKNIEECTFDSCGNLHSINIPNGVLRINNYAFRDCGSLENITFPKSVIHLGYQVLYGCGSLQGITCEATTPPHLDDSTPFEETNYCPIYVPADSLNEYLSDENWSLVSTRINTI